MKKITLLVIALAAFTAQAQTETDIYYNDLRYANEGRGFQQFVTNNPGGEVIEGTLISRIIDDAAFLAKLPYGTRPANTIKDGAATATTRDSKIIIMKGHGNAPDRNFEADIWVVSTSVDVSTNTHVGFSWVSRSRYHEGAVNSDPLKVFVATDYVNGTTPVEGAGAGEFTDITALAVAFDPRFNNGNENPQYFKIDLSAYINDKLTIAFKYEANDAVTPFDSATNRNGSWYVSDMRFFTHDGSLSNNVIATDDFSIANPASGSIEITNNNNLDVANVSLMNIAGNTVYSANNAGSINVEGLANGIYILKINLANGSSLSKKIIVKN